MAGKSAIAARRDVRTYDVARQIAAGHEAAGLVAAIAAVVGGQPDRAFAGESGSAVAISGQVLFVRHHQAGQMAVAQILAELDEIAEDDEDTKKPRDAPLARNLADPVRAVSSLRVLPGNLLCRGRNLAGATTGSGRFQLRAGARAGSRAVPLSGVNATGKWRLGFWGTLLTRAAGPWAGCVAARRVGRRRGSGNARQ